MSTTTGLGDLTGDYVLDTSRTRIGFVARHTMGTKVRGRFDEFEGGAYLDGDHPSASSARIVIQGSSIRTRNGQRDDLLRGRFLDLDNHPVITFTSAGVKQTDETNYQVTGDLSVRGVTRPVTLDVELTGGGSDAQGDFRVGFKGSVTIDRNDWGVNWNAATAVLVSPQVVLEFDVIAIRREP
ncbi:polyisoprenoid-binding protein [Streptomyces viridiviolaceus]|uniref:YceI family protein n=1 Tax=Streptomyces viridiviolaceus TaxID=68282 RepID=A0ABW2E697_9ACTN|nr:YceI family protein [Streptomyces viridiviolaceus]GHB37364.1 polyisoprenoid-binding protein [Streptomyces viridiviolaceus]